MCRMQIHFYSSELTECNSLQIVAPLEGGERYPVLWLLSPMGCNHTRWSAHTDLESLAEQKKMLIVVPDMKLSCGLDMVHGFKYHSMLVKELPLFLEKHFPVDRNRQIIAGAQEGAYAALYGASECPGQYEKVIALSAGCLTEEGALINGDRRFFHAFGVEDMASLKGSSYDMEKQMGKLMEQAEVTIAYGERDKYCRSAARLGKLIGQKDMEHVYVCEGEMSWEQWYRFLE